jgi:hypothetical protein
LFANVIETGPVVYSSNVPQPNEGGGFYEFITGYPLNVDEFETSPVNLSMNIFEPAGDTLSQRPVIIICFGGGFLSGSKDHWSIRLLCQQLAKRGFVTAAIDYRLGMNVFDGDLAMRAVYRGVQDARSAVRFFRADAAGSNTYRIDPNQVYIGGHSSGAFMALHNAYLNEEEERPLSTYDWVQDGQAVSDQGCLDCVGNNQSHDGRANAAFSLAGAIGFTSFIDVSTDPKVVMFHSTDDGTVPYDSGGPFSSIIWLVIGSDLPTVYGSLPISQQCDAIGLPYQFYSYINRGHDVHENGTTQLYTDIIPGISDWFFEQELKPKPDTILGNQIVCSASLQQTYALQFDHSTYYDWQVSGGSFLQMNPQSSVITVEWDTLFSEHHLTVIPYSHLDAKGDSISLTTEVFESATRTFLSINGNWETVSNWSENQLPSPCDDVVLNPSVLPFDLSLSSMTEINTISIGENIHLTLTNSGELFVYQKNLAATSFAFDLNGKVFNHGRLHIQSKVEGKEVKIHEPGILENLGILTIGQNQE